MLMLFSAVGLGTPGIVRDIKQNLYCGTDKLVAEALSVVLAHIHLKHYSSIVR